MSLVASATSLLHVLNALVEWFNAPSVVLDTASIAFKLYASWRRMRNEHAPAPPSDTDSAISDWSDIVVEGALEE